MNLPPIQSVPLLQTRLKHYRDTDFVVTESSNGLMLNDFLLTPKDLTILRMLTIFNYSIDWAINAWCTGPNTFVSSNDKPQLEYYVDYGLVFKKRTAIGDIVYPTSKLRKLFDLPKAKYYELNLKKVEHNIAEQDVYFNITQGTLGIDLPKKVIAEPQYYPSVFQFKRDEWQIEEKKLIKQANLDLESDTCDINTYDFKQNAWVVNNKAPDLVIPVLREIKEFKSGDKIIPVAIPKSIAIEVELTPKHINKYVKILKQYYNNPKFGRVIYLSDNGSVLRKIERAKQEVPDGEYCKIETVPYNQIFSRL